jgi:hypothetical protein
MPIEHGVTSGSGSSSPQQAGPYFHTLMELIADHSPSSMQAPVALWVGHTARVMHSPEAGQEAPSQPGGGSGGGGSDCRNDRSGAFRCL